MQAVALEARKGSRRAAAHTHTHRRKDTQTVSLSLGSAVRV